MTPSASCSRPRFPYTRPRSGVATISPSGVTRFWNAPSGSVGVEREREAENRCVREHGDEDGDERAPIRSPCLNDRPCGSDREETRDDGRNDVEPTVGTAAVRVVDPPADNPRA